MMPARRYKEALLIDKISLPRFVDLCPFIFCPQTTDVVTNVQITKGPGARVRTFRREVRSGRKKRRLHELKLEIQAAVGWQANRAQLEVI